MPVQHYKYDQTQAQIKLLGATDPEGFCESAVCMWHATSEKVSNFGDSQSALMEHFGSKPSTPE